MLLWRIKIARESETSSRDHSQNVYHEGSGGAMDATGQGEGTKYDYSVLKLVCYPGRSD